MSSSKNQQPTSPKNGANETKVLIYLKRGITSSRGIEHNESITEGTLG